MASDSNRPLNTVQVMSRAVPNRVFALISACVLLSLFYRHISSLASRHDTSAPAPVQLLLLLSDLILSIVWAGMQGFRMRPVMRKQFPENLGDEFPRLDVFVCTADPYKEPPATVACTVLSLMAYEYPPESLTVYVSDDGGSELTLYALLEAYKFGRHWLPFCRHNSLLERSPHAYFRSTVNNSCSVHAHEIKIMYESMKSRIESVVEKGKVEEWRISDEGDRRAFSAWTHKFNSRDHPAVIEVLSESGRDTDITGQSMPNLVYVSREKRSSSPHHFKAGALNVLLRVSSIMTNAPIILTVDCDMTSNDPRTPLHALCYFKDPSVLPTLGYIQFPQTFRGLNKNDIYGCEYLHLFQINPLGLDGFNGPNNVGTCCFFSRRAFFGPPSSPKIPKLDSSSNIAGHLIRSPYILGLARTVAACDYEKDNSDWGSKVGFKYGSLVEDFFTGYMMHCEGWKSIFCNPERVGFLGDVPISLNDSLNQCKRWCIGLLQVTFSKYSTLAYGIKNTGLIMGLMYTHYAFWPILCVPIVVYSFVPQITLIAGVRIFPEPSDPWFAMHAFMFLGSYGHDLVDFLLHGRMIGRWWSDQRMWMMKGLSCHLFGLLEYSFNSLGFKSHGFEVTSKAVDEGQSKRYDRGLYEFGVSSPMFVPMVAAAMINMVALGYGIMRGLQEGSIWTAQIALTACVVINFWPVYEAAVFRTDQGKIPAKTIVLSAVLACGIYAMALMY